MTSKFSEKVSREILEYLTDIPGSNIEINKLSFQNYKKVRIEISDIIDRNLFLLFEIRNGEN